MLIGLDSPKRRSAVLLAATVAVLVAAPVTFGLTFLILGPVVVFLTIAEVVHRLRRSIPVDGRLWAVVVGDIFFALIAVLSVINLVMQ